jgi:hypothetical protein
VHIVVHPRDHPEGAPIVGALQKATLLDANKQGVRVLGVKRDVLRVRDMGRCRETPSGHIHRPQGREFRPVAAEIVAIEQMRRLRSGINARAASQSGAGQAIDVVLRESTISLLPGVAAITAGEDRAMVHSCEDCATVWLDQEGVDVLIGQGLVRHVPPWAIGVALHTHHPLNGADQHLLRGGRRAVDRGSAMRESYAHDCLL